jgi:hypothetical protein
MELHTIQDLITYFEQGMEKLKTVEQRKDQVWRRYKRVCQSPNIQSIYSPKVDDLFFSDDDPVPLPTEKPQMKKEMDVKDLEPLAEKIQEEALKPKHRFFSMSPYEFVSPQELQQSIEDDFFNTRETQRKIKFISNVNNYHKFIDKIFNNLQYFNDFKEIKFKIEKDYNFLVLVKTDNAFIDFLCECNCRANDFPDKLQKTTQSLLITKNKIIKLDEILHPEKKPEKKPPETQNPENPQIENPENSQTENSYYEEEEDFIFTEEETTTETTTTELSEIENPENPQIETQQEKKPQKLKNIRTKPIIQKEEPNIEKPNLSNPIITNLNKKPTPISIPTETKPEENQKDDIIEDLFGRSSPVKYIIPSKKSPKKEEDEPDQF